MLLEVRDLATHFLLDDGVLRAVDGVSFHMAPGESVGLVGESGCGKTIVALSILGVVPHPGRVVGGSIRFEGEELVGAPPERLRRVRGGGIGIVFQEPGAALNPVHTVGDHIIDVLRLRRGMSRGEARVEAVRLLDEMEIPRATERVRAYPHELSGGMRQRATIAIAVAARPRLLIADEPTTALDVTVQAEILELLRRLGRDHGMALLLISHDVAVVEEMVGRVLVMYTGKLVETGPAAELFREPRHPYTRGLLASTLRLGAGRDAPLGGIPGTVPDLLALPGGCTFHPRCPIAIPQCRAAFPPLETIGPGRRSACFRVHAAIHA
jgi:oligopeptide/dipeptide ABC transporter ATP-binding protein